MKISSKTDILALTINLQREIEGLKKENQRLRTHHKYHNYKLKGKKKSRVPHWDVRKYVYSESDCWEDEVVTSEKTTDKAIRSKLLHALRTRTISKNKVIPFADVNRVFSRWRIRKQERDELLYNLRQEGFLKIVPYHSVILEEVQP